MANSIYLLIAQKIRALSELCDKGFEKFAFPLSCAAAFFLPIRLIFAYWAISPLSLLWLLKKGPKLSTPQDKKAQIPEAFLLLIGVFSIISVLGRNPLNSLRSCLTLFLFAVMLFAIREVASKNNALKLVFWLVAGQSLAAINTFIAAIHPSYPRVLIGQVSESGQLGISLFLAIGLCAYNIKANLNLHQRIIKFIPVIFLLTILLSILAFLSLAEMDSLWALSCLLLATGIILAVLIKAWKEYGIRALSSIYVLFFLSIPFLCTALLSNLKRGPWAGVLVGSIIFAFKYAKKWVFGIIFIAIILLISFQPIRTRIVESPRHFFMTGGRSEIWKIGSELVFNYPLGVGLKNSKYLREYSLSIPPGMTHFHNNLLNITAETGWIGLSVFLWWLTLVLSHAFRTAENPILARSIGCAIISWQVAGLVEYNFGDSEVLLVALFAIGILSSFEISSQLTKKQRSN
ncbi:MAG: O-antigen ligase family protein [SAR324 cluster bacterium]|uniref:O-antigen ligase family protein n=1 Tax=SAR324 cluster bacterium TaxID=2024889 RepID=A0A7X9FQW9_9DELT|nr:O-antigen ligase family protein [SAR324 cluster bacterium]